MASPRQEDRPAILVQGLTKRYGDRRAVDGLTFSVGRGEVFALLGPNGAGKTTTVEILEGYRRADEGRVEVLGQDPASPALKDRMGVMLQDLGLYLTITPREALNLFSRFYSRPRPVRELLELVGLEDVAGTPFRRLSGGEKKRLGLALALVGCPDVVFLDEPTAGLDPQVRRATWEIIAGLRREGAAVLLTTHYLEEAESLADRVGILRRGSFMALGTPRELVMEDRTEVRIRAHGDVDVESLSRLPSVQHIQRDGDTILLRTDDPRALLAEVTAALQRWQVDVTEIRVGRGLEDVFLELTRERDDA